MKDDLELQIDDASQDDRITSSKRRRIKSDSNKIFPIFLGILLVVVFAGGILYFITRRPMGDDAMLPSKMTSFEEKIVDLERQIAELQGKSGPVVSDPALLKRLEALTQRVEALEKRAQPTMESKTKPVLKQKPAVTAQKRYHTVQKGETLAQISKKYRITVEGLRKLNNLSAGQSIRVGQKLLISLGR